ncbi:hypothetical protein E2562_022098 [Oryza meyeriana var. granulata]|uniref:Uncharacterized protein n=1 Tax=Oryza meyeriana var. granulata TaxID=110450 RepID=A0A6G1ENS6_9ORYZ|nr:hypothetical protein E2562_022098 [Oryza meyeriana var. granulata]
MAEPARWALLILLGVTLLVPAVLAGGGNDPKPPTPHNNGNDAEVPSAALPRLAAAASCITAPARLLAATTTAFIASTTTCLLAATTNGAIASSTSALVAAATSGAIASSTSAFVVAATNGAIASSTSALVAAATSGAIASSTSAFVVAATSGAIASSTSALVAAATSGAIASSTRALVAATGSTESSSAIQRHCNLPGAVCQDPRFIGGDGNTFYFHGRRDRDFCLLSDANLHINAHFIGNHVPGLKRDPTWVQAVAVLFSGHRLYVGARKTAVWDDDSDRLAVVFDGESVQVQRVAHARWEWGSLSVTRTKAANGVLVELDGVFKITANVVPITKEDSRIHRYGVTDDDCLAHLDLAFKFYSLTDDVHGVLGQTYRSSYVNRLDVSAKMPVMGGEKQFTSSGLFAADCAVARFGRAGDADAVAVASDELIDIKCSTGLDGVGVVCKK